ncbi:phosphotransferase [Puniceibacterium sp. IMCC21224]|uniref:phosphotransferase n=1 Tax=Puniceibacterium sp. IMCC21224 TaxID=1618204 RepID=UPI00064DF430|nr:phosphotransferase [Puniceibacterium sp. IMCC21224]KMK65469.1 phosphotransferase family protein [Puniceibacterium sp. IMCC21224]
MQIHDNPALFALWRNLAQQAGLPVDGWEAALASQRNDSERRRVVYHLTRQGVRLALKLVGYPVDRSGFDDEVTAHLSVQERFGGVPQVLAADLEQQAVLMEWAGTETLYDALISSNAPDRQALLGRVGDWVARFHRTGLHEWRVFQPKHTVRHLQRLMTEVETGQKAVAASQDWLAAAGQLCDLQPQFEGRQTVSCLGHGDLNMRNILLGDSVAGIDFRGGGPVPVGHDLARLFVHFGALLAPVGDCIDGVLPGVDISGFWNGYDLVGPDDPSVGFLTRMRILIDWQTLPSDPTRYSAAQTQRFTGLKRLAGCAFT